MKVENKINKILMTLASVLIFGATMVKAREVAVTERDFGLFQHATQSVIYNPDNKSETLQKGTGQMLARAAKHLNQVPVIYIPNP